MRVASGMAAAAGAPPAVTSSGSRGAVTPKVCPLSRDLARGRRERQQRVARARVPAMRRDLRARDDAPAPPPLDVDEPAELQPVPRRRGRERERRAAEHAAAAVAELREAAVAARADDPPCPARAVEELNADPHPLRGVAAVGNRHANADAPGRGRRIAGVDRRPRRRAKLRAGGRGGGDQGGESEREKRRAAAAGGGDGAHARHHIEQVAAEKSSGSAPGVPGWPAAVRRRTWRSTAPSRRHSNVTRPRKTNAGRPSAGGDTVNVRPVWRPRTAPLPTSMNPESPLPL